MCDGLMEDGRKGERGVLSAVNGGQSASGIGEGLSVRCARS